MRHSFVLLTLGALATAACGGEEKPPVQAPPPPPPVTASAPAPAPTETTPPAPPPAPKPSLAELEVLTAKALVDAMNAHDAKKACESYAPEATITVIGIGDVSGRDGCVTETQKWFDAFSDLKFAIGRVFQKGDTVIAEWAWTGTNTGDFMGMKATQRPAGASGVSVVWHDADGRMTKEHRYFDAATIMAQLDPKAKPGSFRAPPALPPAMEVHADKGGPDEQKLVDAAKAMYAAFDGKDVNAFLNTMSDDATMEDMAVPHTAKGKKDAKAAWEMFHRAIPDLHTTIATQIAADGLVATEGEISGTNKGPFGPFRPSNKPVTIHFVDVFEVKDGKMVRGWSYANTKELADQLAPAKPAAPPAKPQAPAKK